MDIRNFRFELGIISNTIYYYDPKIQKIMRWVFGNFENGFPLCHTINERQYKRACKKMCQKSVFL